MPILRFFSLDTLLVSHAVCLIKQLLFNNKLNKYIFSVIKFGIIISMNQKIVLLGMFIVGQNAEITKL